MLRVLFCMTCCSAPANNRGSASRGKQTNLSQTNEKLVEGVDFKNTLGSDEKDRLLANQIQAHNDNYGSKENGEAVIGLNKVLPVQAENMNELSQGDVDHSYNASTSVFLSQSRSLATNEDQDYTKYTELNFDDKSVSAPSSIDIEEYNENPAKKQLVSSGEFAPSSVASEQQKKQKSTTSETNREDSGGKPNDGDDDDNDGAKQVAANAKKIGDYARLEYSPVEDLDSITTKSLSRAESERGGGEQRRLSRAVSSASGARTPRDRSHSENVSRRSSGGIESTSISIASQLSNEQLQQNLTNVLESANSPTALFGTIGLPLGPPLEDTDGTTETRKTSPETPGAALTSASQDSLSGASMGAGESAATGRLNSADLMQTSGGALVGGESLEQSFNLKDSLDAPLANDNEMDEENKDSRVQSALSTTTSGGLTNPTPTPSELSAGGEKKKSSKLKPKNLLKRFKSGKKKNKTESSQ